MSWQNHPEGPQNPGGQNPGGQNPGPQHPDQGGQWGAPPQGSQWGAPPQGGQWGEPTPQNPPQGGHWGVPQGQPQGGQWGQPGGAPQPGFGAQPGYQPTGPAGGQGFDQRGQNFAGHGGYGAPPSGYPNQQRGPGRVILFVLVGVVVVALIGAGFLFFGKSKGEEPTGIDVPPPTTPVTASPEPTASRTPGARPSSAPPTSGRPTSEPTGPSNGTEKIGLGVTVEVAAGWRVKSRESGTIVLAHRDSGALYIVEVRKGADAAVDAARSWQDEVSRGGTNVEKRPVKQKPKVHSSLDLAETSVAMNLSNGGGSQRVVVLGITGVNASKQTMTFPSLVIPESATGSTSALIKDANAMLNSVLRSQAS